MHKPIATPNERKANIICEKLMLKRGVIKRPMSIPITAPPVKGMAVSQFIPPAMLATATPPIDIRHKTPNEVAIIECIGRSLIFFRAGTITKPPPTPNRPDKKPARAPEPIKALAQGTVHISRPIDESSEQGTAFVGTIGIPLMFLYESINVRIAT